MPDDWKANVVSGAGYDLSSRVLLPQADGDRPELELLEWHGDVVYRG